MFVYISPEKDLQLTLAKINNMAAGINIMNSEKK